jgi:hypothetical protein
MTRISAPSTSTVLEFALDCGFRQPFGSAEIAAWRWGGGGEVRRGTKRSSYFLINASEFRVAIDLRMTQRALRCRSAVFHGRSRRRRRSRVDFSALHHVKEVKCLARITQ